MDNPSKSTRVFHTPTESYCPLPIPLFYHIPDPRRRGQGRNWETLSTETHNIKRRDIKKLQKALQRYNQLTPAHADFESLRAKLLSTRWGCKKLKQPFFQAADINAQIVQTLKEDVLPQTGKHMKGLLASQLCSRQTGGIDCAKTDALGLDAKVVRSAKWHEQEAQQTKQNGAAKRRRKAAQTLSRNYPSDITREALPEYVQKMYEDFFMRASYVPSGAKDNLRHVSVLKHELEEELYAMYPAMLRDLSQAHRDELFEHVDRPSNDTYTVLQASIITAEYWATKDGFTPEEEVSHRRDVAVKKYRDKLNHSTWMKRGHSMGPPQKDGPK